MINFEEYKYGEYIKISLIFFTVFTIIGGIPYFFGGVWPPYVTIASDSMSPEYNTGDLVYVIDSGDITDNGQKSDIQVGEKDGDVIVFEPNGDESRQKTIHRAIYWTEKNENWVDDNRNVLQNKDLACDDVRYCPAPHSGYITKGDSNNATDQELDISEPVKAEWVESQTKYRIPYIGYIPLIFRILLRFIFPFL